MKISSIINEFDFLKKSSIKASEGKENGLYPFFTSSDVKRLFIDSFLIDDEVVILGTGGMPSCNYYCGKVSYSTDNIVLKSKGRILAKWLYYFLRNNNLEILANGFHGAGLKHIGKDYVSNIKIPVLSIEKQQFQIQQLDIIFNNINSLNKQLFLNNELIKSRFIEMFKTIDMSEERNEWEPLENLCKIYTGTTPSSTDESNWNGDILWITPAEMNADSFYIYDTVRKITEKGRKSKSLDIMPINTVLLSTRAPIGKVGIVGTPMTCNQGFKNFNCNERLNPVFLYVLLKNNSEYLNSLGSGTTFLEVSKSKIAKTKIPVPSIEQQNEFEQFVKQIDKSKLICQKQLDLLNDLFNKKLDEYFGG